MRVNVMDYGAVGDGATLNTAAFARAVEACSQAGGGYVSVPAGQFVTGTVELKSHVYLELLPGAEILGSMCIADYRGTRRGSAWDPRISAHINQKLVEDVDSAAHINPCKALILAEDQHHVGIIGHGTLNGRRGYAFPSGEDIGNPFLVVFSHCADVTLENVSMTNPGSFTNYLLGCERVTIRGLHIDSTATGCGDGIDFDGGRDVTISDCQIDAGDDGIGLKTLSPDEPCERFAITNCVIRSHYWGCIRIGPETASDFRQITVSNCVFRDSNDGLKLQLCEDRVFEDFVFSNIVMDRVTRPIFLTLNHYPFSVHSHSVRPACGAIRRMTFTGITALLTERREDPVVGPVTPYSGCVIYSLPDGVLEDLTFSHIRLACLGGGSTEAAQRANQPDMLDFYEQYPESCLKIGEPPAAAFYLRNARHVRFDDVAVTCAEPDARAAFAAENIQNLSLHGVRAEQTAGLLRHHLCDNLTVEHCDGVLTGFTPAQAADYAAARSLSAALDARMQEIAGLMDSLSGRSEAAFDALEGAYLPAGAGGVLYLPQTKGSFTVKLNGQTVSEYEIPEEYRTKTCFACRVPAMQGAENTLRVYPGEGFEGEECAAFFYRDAL